MSENPNPLPPDVEAQVRAQIAAQAAAQQRAQDCIAEIDAVLAKHGCRLEFRQLWVNGQPGKQIQVVAVPLENS